MNHLGEDYKCLVSMKFQGMWQDSVVKEYLSLAVFTDSLECMYWGKGEGKGRGRGRDSDIFLNKRQAKVFQSGTTQVDGNDVQVT